jgi:hypothetical protein
MNKSSERHTFQAENYIKRCEEAGKEPRQDYLDMYENAKAHDLDREADEKWRESNLEYDLRSNQWICNKAKASDTYAQNIYAALCNQDWQKNDVWPLLKGQIYSCSWRYAGGIVADMREEGDYINWYCSGIRDQDDPNNGFVPESHVTDEIREDFFKLGWIPVDHKDDEIT